MTNYVYRIILIILFVLITLSFFHSPGTPDVKFLLTWIKIVDANGPFSGFEIMQQHYPQSSPLVFYPPFSLIILSLTAKIAHLFSIDFFTASKLTLLIFLLSSSLIFWIWTKDLFVTLLLHFSLLLNSLFLVYRDIFFAPSLILSLWAIKERKMILFTVFYSIACLIKWQPIIIAPFILLYILNIKKITEWKKINVKELMLSVLLPLSIIVTTTFILFKMPLLKSFVSAIKDVHLSGNALNFSWIMTYFLHVFYPDIFGPLVKGQADFIITGSLKVLAIPKALFLIFYTGAFLSYFKQEKSFENLIYYSLIGFMAYFIFNTGVHENHLFVPAILAAILLYLNREHLMISVFIIITSNLNMIIFYGIDGKGLGFSRVVGVDVTLLFSVLNVIFFLLIWNSTCLQWKKQT